MTQEIFRFRPLFICRCIADEKKQVEDFVEMLRNDIWIVGRNRFSYFKGVELVKDSIEKEKPDFLSSLVFGDDSIYKFFIVVPVDVIERKEGDTYVELFDKVLRCIEHRLSMFVECECDYCDAVESVSDD